MIERWNNWLSDWWRQMKQFKWQLAKRVTDWWQSVNCRIISWFMMTEILNDKRNDADRVADWRINGRQTGWLLKDWLIVRLIYDLLTECRLQNRQSGYLLGWLVERRLNGWLMNWLSWDWDTDLFTTYWLSDLLHNWRWLSVWLINCSRLNGWLATEWPDWLSGQQSVCLTKQICIWLIKWQTFYHLLQT